MIGCIAYLSAIFREIPAEVLRSCSGSCYPARTRGLKVRFRSAHVRKGRELEISLKHLGAAACLSKACMRS